MKNTSLDPELRKMNAGQELELYSETNFVLELLSDLDKPEPTPTPDRVLTSLERAKDAFLFADLAQYESEQDRLSDNAKTLALFSIADSLDIIAKALDSGTLLVKDVDKY